MVTVLVAMFQRDAGSSVPLLLKIQSASDPPNPSLDKRTPIIDRAITQLCVTLSEAEGCNYSVWFTEAAVMKCDLVFTARHRGFKVANVSEVGNWTFIYI